VVSVSFGSCEAALGGAGNLFWSALWQQAAAQGMSVVVSAGDSGAAGCDSSSAPSSSGPRSVNGICSSPYSTCAGGTEFDDAANPGLFWAASNKPGTYGSALGYIPEVAWNESGAAAAGTGLWATGGGASTIYTKPSWQAGTGVPQGNWRYVPDVSLASAAREGFFAIINGGVAMAGGTSVAAPSFAGLMALTGQLRGAALGNPNPVLYTLRALQDRGGAPVFHDVTAGNNSVPGLTGFSAGAGYDEATGLGSVDANLLADNWNAGATPVTAPTPAGPQATPCTYRVTLEPVVANGSAYSGAATVTTKSSCSWTATSNAGWLTVQAGSNGTGPGRVSYTATSNTGNAIRSGNLVIAGATITATEPAGRPLKLSMSGAAAK
jgi:subtilase family serine protease